MEDKVPSNTPPVTTIQNEEIVRNRNKACRIIEELGARRKDPSKPVNPADQINERMTISSAIVLFHRFFAVHSYYEHDKYVVAIASLFLACKIEESPRRLNEIVSHYFSLHRDRSKSVSPSEVEELSKKVIVAERIILHTVGFELQIEHPYSPCIQKIKGMKNIISRAKEAHQLAFNFINDSFRTTLCLQYPPIEIGLAALYLVFLSLDIPPPDKRYQEPGKSKNWLQWINCKSSESVVKDICNQILDSYIMNNLNRPPGGDYTILAQSKVNHLKNVFSKNNAIPDFHQPTTDEGEDGVMIPQVPVTTTVNDTTTDVDSTTTTTTASTSTVGISSTDMTTTSEHLKQSISKTFEVPTTTTTTTTTTSHSTSTNIQTLTVIPKETFITTTDFRVPTVPLGNETTTTNVINSICDIDIGAVPTATLTSVSTSNDTSTLTDMNNTDTTVTMAVIPSIVTSSTSTAKRRYDDNDTTEREVVVGEVEERKVERGMVVETSVISEVITSEIHEWNDHEEEVDIANRRISTTLSTTISSTSSSPSNKRVRNI